MNKHDLQHDMAVLRSAKLSYLTICEFCQLKGHVFKHHVVTCTQLSNLLKVDIKQNAEIVRHINSKTSTDKLAYADWFKVPGSDNYKEIFHYRHHLTPDDKHKVRTARQHVALDKNTYKLDPDMSAQAPVYTLPNQHRPWEFHLIFVDTVINQLTKQAESIH